MIEAAVLVAGIILPFQKENYPRHLILKKWAKFLPMLRKK
jgi:hypothetical protein